MEQKLIDEAIAEIAANHRKIIDDFCKAYMAERYARGESINVGDFVLFQQSLPHESMKMGYKYWMEPKEDKGRLIPAESKEMYWILIKFLKESIDFLATDPSAKGMNRGAYIQSWMDANLQKEILNAWLPHDP